MQPHFVSVPIETCTFLNIRTRDWLIYTLEKARCTLNPVAEHGILVRTNTCNSRATMERLIRLGESGRMKGKSTIILDEKKAGKEKETGLDMGQH